MRGERSADPTRVNHCPGCGRDCLPTPLGNAEHRAKHLDRPESTTPAIPRLDAWRAYAHELEHLASDLRGQIAHLEDERRRLLEDVATRDEAIGDLEADYSGLLRELAEAAEAARAAGR